MNQKIRIKLYSATGAKTRDFEFTFPDKTTEQHANAVFDALETICRYHPGFGKKIGSSPTDTNPIIHNHHSPSGSAPEAVKAKGSEQQHS